ncbi:MAG: chromosome segregation protein SMC [Firmicutes bacterium]|nr:chromosome segregation protein SMC [Bacillota bacterium]
MYFKRLEMHGFKSFAEPVVIEFHEGVTCIVGPNGSGKSNISDAIRWVLGEQSAKMLRGGKMEEVIFSGTANRKSRGMAEVTLVIDNSTGILPIDYNEVAITRRMYRSGENQYLINNNQCRLRDIRELIMDTGIGVDGYSLIGQGKIADIVSNKPESRREIFEEAAGVVMYKTKKAEAERKLASTNANLERVNDIIGEIEGRIDGLREDSIKAKEYLELKEKYRELEINITLKNVEKLDIANSAIKEDVEQLNENIETLNVQKKSMDEQLAGDRARNENLEQLSNDARDKLLVKIEEINRLTNKSQLDSEKLAGIDRDYIRITEEIQSLDEKLSREAANAEELEENKDRVLENLKNEETRLGEKVGAYNQVMSRSLEINEAVENAKNEMFSLHSRVSAKRSEAKSMDSYRESLAKRKAQLLSEGAEIEKNSKAFIEAAQRGKQQKAETENNIKETAEKLTEAKKLQAEINEELRSLSKQGEDVRIRAGQLSARKKTIEEMENNYEGYNGAVKFVMKSGIRGIEGVVAELMKVPSGFEIAVETALGGSLQNIVCQKDANAKEAINALKNNKAGRLTFLPMESVKGSITQPGSKVTGAPGFKGMASDIVEFDSKYEGIFQYLLGKVAVVEDMDSAVSLSKVAGSGIRFVTLDGEIINASGAITGGKYKNATANLLARRSEIDKLNGEIAGLKKEYLRIEENIKDRTEDNLETAENIVKLEEKLRNLQIEAANINAQLNVLEENTKEIQQTGAKRERELASIEQDSEKAEKMASDILAEADEAEKRIKVLDQEISDGMEKAEAIKDEVTQASEEITRARIAKTDWDNKLEAVDQLLSRVQDAIDDLTVQIDDKNDQLEVLEKQKNKILFSSEDVEGLVEGLTKEKTELEDYIAQIAAEKSVLVEALGKMTAEYSTIGDKLNSYQDQKYQQEIKLAKNETQLDTIKDKLWEEFEISYVQALEFRKDDFVLTTAVKESREIKNRIRQLGDVNVGSIKEYEQVSERYSFLTEQRSDITVAMDELKAIIDDMEKTIKSRFKENFDKIVDNFEDIFKELFGGGHAELRLDNEDNPLESGIEIIAQPPGKKLQNINLMSGGEKTMTAIALMFAVLKTKPTPFCILDEVEAALDDANIDRFAKYLRKFYDIQFAIVTHQKATMEHADVLYGVTMPEQGISKVLSLRLGDKIDL